MWFPGVIGYKVGYEALAGGGESELVDDDVSFNASRWITERSDEPDRGERDRGFGGLDGWFIAASSFHVFWCSDIDLRISESAPRITIKNLACRE